MKNSIHLYPLLLATLFCTNRPAIAEETPHDASEFQPSVVHLVATKAVPDPEAPWTIQNMDVSGFAGVLIGENRILAPASLVARAVMIQAQRIEEIAKVPLKVIFADYEANLAVLAPSEGSLSGMTPLPVGDELPLNSDLWMLGIENDRQLQRASVKILELTLREVIPGGMQVSSYLLTGQSRSSCRGEPLIRGGKLVGLCMGTTDNQPWALTAMTIRHFLNDHLEEGKYRGFPVLGMGLNAVKSPHLRKEMNWPEGVTGLRVANVHETSAFAEDVKVNDLLIAIDGQRIDNRGFFRHPLWGPIPLRHYLAGRYAGEKVTVKLQRGANTFEFSRPMRRFNGQDYRIPGATFEGGVAHLIIGGLVFRELGADFLSSFGRDWTRSAPPHLLYLYHYGNIPLLSRVRQIVMSHVLGDSFNQGYDREGLLLLDNVNGSKVANLDELRLAAANRPIVRGGEKFDVFDFQNGAQIILPMNGMSDAHVRIAKAYNIGTPNSFLTINSNAPVPPSSSSPKF